jgi:hypothetical protein
MQLCFVAESLDDISGKQDGLTKPVNRQGVAMSSSDEFALFAFVACVLVGGGAAFITYVA